MLILKSEEVIDMHRREDVKDVPKRKCPSHRRHISPRSLPQRHPLISCACSLGQPPFRKVRDGSGEGMSGAVQEWDAQVGGYCTDPGQRRWETTR